MLDKSFTGHETIEISGSHVRAERLHQERVISVAKRGHQALLAALACWLQLTAGRLYFTSIVLNSLEVAPSRCCNWCRQYSVAHTEQNSPHCEFFQICQRFLQSVLTQTRMVDEPTHHCNRVSATNMPRHPLDVLLPLNRCARSQEGCTISVPHLSQRCNALKTHRRLLTLGNHSCSCQLQRAATQSAQILPTGCLPHTPRSVALAGHSTNGQRTD